MLTDEQQRENERAREEALRQMASIGGLGPQVASALTPATDPGAAFDDEGVGPITIEPSSEPDPQAIDTDALTDPETGTASPIHPMQGEDDYGPAAPAITELARDDAEPLGSVARTGPQQGQMFAPSGVRESPEERLARLSVGGDFGPQIPPEQPVSPASAIPSTVETPDPATTTAKPDGGDSSRSGLDFGLPTEEDLAHARGRSAMHRVGDAFRNAASLMIGGGGVAPRASEADAMALERRRGLQAALQRKGVMRGQEAQQEATSARQAVQDRLAERRVAAAEAMVPSRVAATEATTERTRAQTEHTRLTSDEIRGEALFRSSTREQREDPASTASDGMRRAVRARLAEMGLAGEAAAAEIGDVDALNANQLHDILPTLMQGVGIRTSRAGGGGGAAPVAPGHSLAEQYVEHGLAESVEQAQAEIDALGGAESARATQRLASRMDEETPPPPTGSVQANIAAAQGAADEIQGLIARSGRDIPGIGRLDAMVPTVALSEEGRRMRALVLNLSDNYLRMVSGAAIPEHEIESFAERLGSSDEPIFREQVARIQREIARRQTGSAATPATASHRRPRTQAPEPEAPAEAPAAEDFSSMTDEELRAIAEGG